MKSKIFYLLLAVTFVSLPLHPQEKDSLIQLYPGLGNTIDLFDREFFNLYSNIEGFQEASLYIRNNNKLISRLKLKISNEIIDTTFIQPLAILDKVRLNIAKLDNENNKKLGIETDAIVSLKDERLIKGRLSMFSKSNLYLISENEDENKILQSDALKIRLSNVNQINVLGQTRTWSYAGWGALIGLAFGGLVFLTSKEDNSTSPGIGGFGTRGLELISGPILGGLVGLIIGSGSSTDDEIIQIESQYDFLKLKDYAKYYFRYDESVEQEYTSIK
jgi:hypothetical protein